jgi:thioredoxin-related protein
MQKLHFRAYVMVLMLAGVGMTPPLKLGIPPVAGFKSGRSPVVGATRVPWLSLKEAQEKGKAEPRILIIDIYTDWCYWCKVMEEKTYSHPEVADYINQHFYPVKFNAETRDSIPWKGQTFHYNPDYKVNELALSLTQGQLAFPTTVIVTPDGNPPQYISGFLKPSDLEPILRYFGDGAYKSQSFSEFSKNFHPHWK